ncbi:MAG: hypothetical protein QOF76_1671 [Solirubrobacteraceae bacterium]|jgi:DNA-binding transcriptional ArsR family regulator|nr:hypothetical protein [Solirubrobacteraceae bacterium]
MVRFEFTLDDLARTRFAISPMWELISGLRRLRDPASAAPHLPWVREALPIARELDLETVFALTPPRGYMPDFISPPPTTPVARVEDELEKIRATPLEHIAGDIRRLYGAAAPECVTALLDEDSGAMDDLVDVLREFWDRALAPHWPRVRATLEADLQYRAHRLTSGGPEALFADLHPSIVFADSALEVHEQCSIDRGLQGQGLILVPSAFHWQRVSSIGDPPWHPTILYPARGVALLWEPGEPAPDALAAVLGRRRAELLAMLTAPASTTDLAARLGASPGGISMHLTALRDAGLVSSARSGRAVLYTRTPAADSLFPPSQTGVLVPN